MAADIYDPLNIITAAQRSSGDWWNQTLQNARTQYNMEQQAYNDSFAREKKYQLFPSEIDAERNRNRYNALRFEDSGRMLENGLSPENMQARFDKQNYDYQKPALNLYTADQVARAPSYAVGLNDALDNMPARFNAPGLHGYLGGQVQRQNVGTNIDAVLSSGSPEVMTQGLNALGIRDTQVLRDPVTGGYVMRTPQGDSMPMTTEQFGNMLRQRTGYGQQTPYMQTGAQLAKEYRTDYYRDNGNNEKRLTQIEKMLGDEKAMQQDPQLRQSLLNERQAIMSGRSGAYSPPPQQSTVNSVIQGANLSPQTQPSSRAATAAVGKSVQPAYSPPAQVNAAPVAPAQPWYAGHYNTNMVNADGQPNVLANGVNGTYNWFAEQARKARAE